MNSKACTKMRMLCPRFGWSLLCMWMLLLPVAGSSGEISPTPPTAMCYDNSTDCSSWAEIYSCSGHYDIPCVGSTLLSNYCCASCGGATPAPPACPATCRGYSCDFLIANMPGTTCSQLVVDYECDCSGCSSCSPPPISQTYAIQRRALEALYAATAGENWLQKRGWTSESMSHCDWYGISCNQDGNLMAM